jgi:hypothetical protein
MYVVVSKNDFLSDWSTSGKHTNTFNFNYQQNTIRKKHRMSSLETQDEICITVQFPGGENDIRFLSLSPVTAKKLLAFISDERGIPQAHLCLMDVTTGAPLAERHLLDSSCEIVAIVEDQAGLLVEIKVDTKVTTVFVWVKRHRNGGLDMDTLFKQLPWDPAILKASEGVVLGVKTIRMWEDKDDSCNLPDEADGQKCMYVARLRPAVSLRPKKKCPKRRCSNSSSVDPPTEALINRFNCI